MSTRVIPMSANPEDLEETAELPLLEAGAQPEAVVPDAAAPDTAAREAAVQAEEIGTLRTSLATATETRGELECNLQLLTTNLRDLEERLNRKSDQLSLFEREVGLRDRRIAGLESDIESRTATLGALQAVYDALTAELEGMRSGNTSLQTSLRDAEQAHATLMLEHSLSVARIARAQADAADHQRRSERFREQLQSLDGRQQFFDVMLGEREQLVSERDIRIAQLESEVAERIRHAGTRENDLVAELAAERERAQCFEADLGRAQTEIGILVQRAEQTGATMDAQLAAAGQRIAALEVELQDYDDTVRSLRQQLTAVGQCTEAVSADLLAAEDRIRTLEGERRSRHGTIERLERAGQEATARIAEITRALEERNALISRLETEAASSAEVLGSIQMNLERMGHANGSAGTAEPASAPQAVPAGSGSSAQGAHASFDNASRLLVRADDDSDIAHVLGHRTSIGRTADNDLRIDADSISRHHAVVLTTTSGTVIEDLNSTNGVFVNGRKISRQQLKEGDLVMIGRTEFRFIIKAALERPAL
jgi:chromosome segregation ATPase